MKTPATLDEFYRIFPTRASRRYQARVTAGTPFQGTRVPLRARLPAMFYRQLVARSSRSAAALDIASSGIASRPGWRSASRLDHPDGQDQ